MTIKDIDGEEYRELLKMLNGRIYEFAAKKGIDINNTKQLIEFCSNFPKIKLGKDITEFLLDGIMHYDVGDQRVLKFIDLSKISFAGRKVRRVDFRGTNANIDPQTVKDKSLEGANFEGIDMSGKCFDGCIICYADLSYTNAIINPQTIVGKNLAYTGCSGLDLSQADFTDVLVKGAYFKNAKLNLDPQTVAGKDLELTILENVDMSGKKFDGCNLSWCNLTNTNAVLDLRSINIDALCGSKLIGTTLLVEEGFNKESLKRRNVTIGKIKFNDFTLIRKRIKSVFNQLN